MKLSTKNFLIQLNKDVFAISAISFAALFFLELIKPKFVIAYINLNYVLLLSLASGIFIAIFEKETAEVEDNVGSKEKMGKGMLLVFSIITFIFILLFTRDLGAWGVLISLVGGMVSFLLGITLE